VHDVKNGFSAALAFAGIEGFTWHDLRHTFASWLMMRGASLRSVAELLGHQSMKMTMRYAHLSSAFLSAEVSLLDPPMPEPTTVPLKPNTTTAGRVEKLESKKRAKCSRRRSRRDQSARLVREDGSPHWTISATGSSGKPRNAAVSKTSFSRAGCWPSRS
jgi:hypothetical protein